VFSLVDRALCSTDLQGQEYAAQQFMRMFASSVQRAQLNSSGRALHGKFAAACEKSANGEKGDFATILPLEADTTVLLPSIRLCLYQN
jgi:hypothetical protein